MKTLTLIIKQKYFDEIIKGTKKQEFREVKPSNVKLLIELDDEGYEKEDENANTVPVIYDAIRFYVGYRKGRDTALVEVLGTHSEIHIDENGEPIEYEYEGKIWVEERVVYDLGRVLER